MEECYAERRYTLTPYELQILPRLDQSVRNMGTRKHNEFLETGVSDDEISDHGYDSQVEDIRKGGRSSKRRKLESDGSGDEDGVSDQQAKAGAPTDGNVVVDSVEGKSKSHKSLEAAELPGISKPLTKKNLVGTAAAIKRSGVVYLSRIPPFMKPSKLRSLLEPYGAINRIFLTPEDPSSHARRVRNGGNKKRSFIDGWIEYINKADAKKACELLNTKTIGGKKGTYYHDDVWNLLYLKGFKWHNLTEQITAENMERASRMRAEITKTTKENKVFVQNVERAKMLDGMESKKAARRAKEDGDGARTEVSETAQVSKKGGERAWQFKQTAVVAKKKVADQPEQVKRVLNKIF
jgi:ESF2/ABP1 family protein